MFVVAFKITHKNSQFFFLFLFASVNSLVKTCAILIDNNVLVNARRRLSDVPVRAKAGFAAAVRFTCYRL
jgi:hypothetical protein